MRTRQAAKRMWPYIRPHVAAMATALFLSIPMAAIKVSPAPAVKYLTDSILVSKDKKALVLLPLGIVAMFLLNFVIRFFHYYLIRAAGDRTVQRLRNDIYTHLLSLSQGYFSEAQGGKLLSKVMNDVQQIVHAIRSSITLIREPFIFLGLLGYAFYLNWRLTLLTLTITPLMVFVFSNTGRHSKRYSVRILDRMGDLSSVLAETFSGMRVIQSFRLEAYLRGRFMKINRDLTRTSLKAARLEEFAHPAVEFLTGIAIALVLYYGGSEVLHGRMSAGDIFAFFTCFGLMVQPIRTFNEINIRIQQCTAAAASIFQLMDIVPEIKDVPGAKKLPKFQHSIEFSHVGFRYGKAGEGNGSVAQTEVLRGFNLEVKRGEMVALVGASGAGKSTVLSLIPRFYDVTSGSVKIDGVDVREATLASIRDQVALVTQEVFLFHDTVHANLKAGRHSVTDAQMEAALKAAQAWNYVQKLPKGIDTEIGDRGQKLSGGERQRLSIARAILKDAPILLLDEATSALDSENERLVQAALDKLLEGRTAIVVAHRLSTIRKAHRIVVMERGQIVEVGAHDELIARGGAYARALALQEGFSS